MWCCSRNERRILLDLKNKIVPESYDPEANIKVIIHGYSSLDFMKDVINGTLIHRPMRLLKFFYYTFLKFNHIVDLFLGHGLY